MGTWYIYGGNGDATINSSGLATFPENTGSTNQVYTITYVDENGCSRSTTYTKVTGSTCQGCTYYIYSNVDGSLVTVRNGNQVIGTCTISGGVCSITSSIHYNTVNVEIRKEGYEFSPSTGTVSCGGSITLNGWQRVINKTVQFRVQCTNSDEYFNSIQYNVKLAPKTTGNTITLATSEWIYHPCTENPQQYVSASTENLTLSGTISQSINNYNLVVSFDNGHNILKNSTCTGGVGFASSSTMYIGSNYVNIDNNRTSFTVGLNDVSDIGNNITINLFKES